MRRVHKQPKEEEEKAKGPKRARPVEGERIWHLGPLAPKDPGRRKSESNLKNSPASTGSLMHFIQRQDLRRRFVNLTV